MRKPTLRILISILLLSQHCLLPAQAAEKLRIQNFFKSPEEVIRYYCNRDAAGFVWSGLTEAERKAFTLWKETPQHDSFLIAKKFEILPTRMTAADTALIEVRYTLSALGDAHGTRLPPPQTDTRVHFLLKRIQGVWKIAQPDAPAILPILTEAGLRSTP